MQEQNEQNEAKPAGRPFKKDVIWISICAFIVVVLLGLGIYAHKDIPFATRGETHSPFPWIGDGIALTSVEARWENTEESGSSYLKTHLGYHPVVKLHIAPGCGGSGTLAIRVTDGDLNQQENPVYLRCVDGKFVTVVRRNSNDLVEAKDDEATLHLICGMGKHSLDAKDFMYHVATRERRLWRVYVYYKSATDEEYGELGYTTIPATGDEL